MSTLAELDRAVKLLGKTPPPAWLCFFLTLTIINSATKTKPPSGVSAPLHPRTPPGTNR